MCTQCANWNILEQKLASVGHELLEINSGNITYKCGTCGSERTVLVHNAPTSNVCAKCYNSHNNKKDIEKIRQELDDIGMNDYELIEYKNT